MYRIQIESSSQGGWLSKTTHSAMSSNHAAEESYPTPTSILSKGGTGKTPMKSWGTKATDAVRFAQYVNESQGNCVF